MAQLSHQVTSRLGDTGSLLKALDAMTNWRAFVLLAGTAVTLAIVLTLFGRAGIAMAGNSAGAAGLTALIGALLSLAVLLIGINAAGITLMDEATDRAPRSPVNALLASVFTVHRLIATLLIAFLAFLAYLLLLASILYLCKIPALGSLLLAVVLPTAVVASGLVVLAFLAVVLPVTGPAVWNGSSVIQILATITAVVRQRLLYVVILGILLSLLLSVVVALIGVVLGSGIGIVGGMTTAVLDLGAGGLGPLELVAMLGAGGRGGDSGPVLGLAFGLTLLFFLIVIPPVMVLLKGWAIIYLQAVDGLSLEEAQAAMQERMDRVKQQAHEVRERARQQATMHTARPGEPSGTPAAPPPPPPSAPTKNCRGCGTPLVPGDGFCENCGEPAG
ncbi:MAG: hypothetical protein SFU57_10020 [Gemmatimonadales bacterium]|nr:hypothetical protein [Gemmatimonadales bacterium]